MPFTPSLDISIRFRADAEIVWAALVDKKLRRDWWPHVRIRTPETSSKVTGKGDFSLVNPEKERSWSRAEASGSITKIKAPRKIRADLVSQPGGFETALRIDLTQLERKTKLQLVEQGFPEGRHCERIVAECRDWWRAMLEALDDYLAEPENVERIERRIRAG
ncbi:SRPBCC domain-containing protein [Gulosibacter sp. 10]|uniref:SRPBCC family protein n=1 Tax=Gulosibacter sp. 10 TaxID=1255570 RepID=UPI00097E7A8D|nr:SRPBCC domain-containing protein [Gulosibacter sp. 10]SJM52758.1 hypothetical protein FM112_02605 [Gulosibacter sp. 10]